MLENFLTLLQNYNLVHHIINGNQNQYTMIKINVQTSIKKYVHTFHSQSNLLSLRQASLFLPQKKPNPHEVSCDKLIFVLPCLLVVTRSSCNYFMSCHYTITIVGLSCWHSKLSLCGPVDLLHFDNSKSICWGF